MVCGCGMFGSTILQYSIYTYCILYILYEVVHHSADRALSLVSCSGFLGLTSSLLMTTIGCLLFCNDTYVFFVVRFLTCVILDLVPVKRADLFHFGDIWPKKLISGVTLVACRFFNRRQVSVGNIDESGRARQLFKLDSSLTAHTHRTKLYWPATRNKKDIYFLYFSLFLTKGSICKFMYKKCHQSPASGPFNKHLTIFSNSV